MRALFKGPAVAEFDLLLTIRLSYCTDMVQRCSYMAYSWRQGGHCHGSHSGVGGFLSFFLGELLDLNQFKQNLNNQNKKSHDITFEQ